MSKLVTKNERRSSVYILTFFASLVFHVLLSRDIFVDPVKINSHRDSAWRMREPNFMDLYNIIFYSTGIHSTGGCLIGWEIETKKCLSLTVFEASEVTDLIYKSAVLSWPSSWMKRIHQRMFWRMYGEANEY